MAWYKATGLLTVDYFWEVRHRPSAVASGPGLIKVPLGKFEESAFVEGQGKEKIKFNEEFEFKGDLKAADEFYTDMLEDTKNWDAGWMIGEEDESASDIRITVDKTKVDHLELEDITD